MDMVSRLDFALHGSMKRSGAAEPFFTARLIRWEVLYESACSRLGERIYLRPDACLSFESSRMTNDGVTGVFARA